MVGLIRIEPQPINLPAFAILAGRFRTSNNGNHSNSIVNATGSLGVTVRCVAATTPAAGCLEYRANSQQIAGPLATGYTGPPAVSPSELDALIDVAEANGTYYTSCTSNLTGDVVVLDTSARCSYTGNTVYNSASNPGLLIVLNGGLEFGGGTDFHGLVYHANQTNSTSWNLVEVLGNARIIGGVIVEGNAGVTAGSSGQLNILFSANAFNDINSFGTAGVVQNTWREIPPL